MEIKDIKVSGRPPERPSVVGRANSRRGDWTEDEWRDLDAIYLKAMAAEESSRYLDVGGLLRDLDRFRESRPLEARQPHTSRYRLNKFLRRNRAQVMAAAGVLVVIAGLIAFFAARLTAERNRALAEAGRTRRVQQFLLDLLSNGDSSAAPSKSESLVTLLDRRAATSLKQLNSDPETQTEYYSLVARLYEQQFEFPKAERFARLAVEKSRALPATSRVAIEASTQLALVRGDQAAAKEAELIAQKTLRQARQYLPPNDIVIAHAESALGRVLEQSGQYDKAIALLKGVVNRTLDGEMGDAVLSDSLESLGNALYQSGHWQEAEATFRKGLALDQKKGDDHPRVATDLANIAAALSSRGDLVEAKKFYLKAADC